MQPCDTQKMVLYVRSPRNLALIQLRQVPYLKNKSPPKLCSARVDRIQEEPEENGNHTVSDTVPVITAWRCAGALFRAIIRPPYTLNASCTSTSLPDTQQWLFPRRNRKRMV